MLIRSRAKSYLIFAIISALFLWAILPSVGRAESVFKYSLSIGNTGDDVKLLQQILNQDSRTRVATSGPGSAGRESRFFGSLTKEAVIRFQEVYREEILSPIGLKRGTGYVGPGTIKVLEKLALGREVSGSFSINSLSPTITRAGGPVNFKFTGQLGAEAYAVVNNQQVAIRPNGASQGIFLTLPAGLPGGVYDLYLVNGGQTSNSLKLTILAGESPVSSGAPTITGLTPNRGGYGTTVVISGTGFSTNANNTLFLGYDKITGVASTDGKTLTFTIPSVIPHLNFPREVFTGFSQVERENAWLPFWVYVQLSSGQESNSELFTFTFYNQ